MQAAIISCHNGQPSGMLQTQADWGKNGSLQALSPKLLACNDLSFPATIAQVSGANEDTAKAAQHACCNLAMTHTMPSQNSGFSMMDSPHAHCACGSQGTMPGQAG